MIIKNNLKLLAMIPLMILYTLERLNVISLNEQCLLKFKAIIHKILLLLILLVLTSTQAFNDPIKETASVFQILKNQKVIGTIKIVMSNYGDSIIYDSESQINAKLLVKFSVIGKERSVFKNGILIYSSVYRKLNNKVKANHSIAQQGTGYKLIENNKTELLNIKNIEQNLITLYFKEPKGLHSVYCDNQKEMIHVKCLGQGIYKVEISNGKYNIFHYKNEKCVKVEVVSPMFDVILIPS